MRYWYDTEFIEDGVSIELLSIGIVAEDGREFYAENGEADLRKASPWVVEHVLPNMWSQQPCANRPSPWASGKVVGGFLQYREIRDAIKDFCNPCKYGIPEFWADYAAYDHVALCQLFGMMVQLPPNYPMYTRDLRQEIDRAGIEPATQLVGNHNALSDARWVRDSHLWLEQKQKPTLLSLNFPESHAVLIGWVRYCLTRRSYAVSECTDFLKSRWNEIEPSTQTIILRDIKEAIADDDRTLELIRDKLADVDFHGDVSVHRRWDKCDRADWDAVIANCLEAKKS